MAKNISRSTKAHIKIPKTDRTFFTSRQCTDELMQKASNIVPELVSFCKYILIHAHSRFSLYFKESQNICLQCKWVALTVCTCFTVESLLAICTRNSVSFINRKDKAVLIFAKSQLAFSKLYKMIEVSKQAL